MIDPTPSLLKNMREQREQVQAVRAEWKVFDSAKGFDDSPLVQKSMWAPPKQKSAAAAAAERPSMFSVIPSELDAVLNTAAPSIAATSADFDAPEPVDQQPRQLSATKDAAEVKRFKAMLSQPQSNTARLCSLLRDASALPTELMLLVVQYALPLCPACNGKARVSKPLAADTLRVSALLVCAFPSFYVDLSSHVVDVRCSLPACAIIYTAAGRAHSVTECTSVSSALSNRSATSVATKSPFHPRLRFRKRCWTRFCCDQQTEYPLLERSLRCMRSWSPTHCTPRVGWRLWSLTRRPPRRNRLMKRSAESPSFRRFVAR
jgi:hypothetical protein